MSATTATVMTFQLRGAAGDKLLVLNTLELNTVPTKVSVPSNTSDSEAD